MIFEFCIKKLGSWFGASWNYTVLFIFIFLRCKRGTPLITEVAVANMERQVLFTGPHAADVNLCSICMYLYCMTSFRLLGCFQTLLPRMAKVKVEKKVPVITRKRQWNLAILTQNQLATLVHLSTTVVKKIILQGPAPTYLNILWVEGMHLLNS